GLPGLDTVLTAGCVPGVEHGLDVLTAEAGRQGERGYAVNVMAGGGLMTRHVPVLRAHGLDTFHVGTSVRQGGWDAPIDRAAVRRWRQLIETDPGQPDRDDL
ncbi:copper homeostasis protein CutC, partial [Streptomyces sp. NPDC052002]